MNLEEVDELLKKLAKKKPIFENEKDFQYALSHELARAYPNCLIYLEGRPLRIEEDFNYDICMVLDDTEIFFELKHKPTKFTATIKSKEYQLKSQDANDLYSYDFLFDVWRLELAVTKKSHTGFAIFLSNDHRYWSGARKTAHYYPFRLEDKREIKKNTVLAWTDSKEKKGTGRQLDLTFEQDYTFEWQDYSIIENGTPIEKGQFRYLLLEINKS